MDPQHPNHRGERGLRAVTSSPAAPAHLPATGALAGARPAGFDGNSQYDRFLLRVTSRAPGADVGESVAVAAGITRQERRRR